MSRCSPFLLLLLLGCPTSDPAFLRDDDDAGDDDTGDDDTGDDDAGDDDATDDDDAGDDDTNGDSVTLVVRVQRQVDCTGDCVGTLYGALLDAEPGANPPANLLATAVEEQADFRDTGDTVEVTLEGLTVSQEARFFSGFFDDDGTADPSNPRPDPGDLLATDAGAQPTVRLDTPGAHTLSVRLTTVR